MRTYPTGVKHWAFKHGKADSPEYKVWNNMYSRCLNPNHPRYKDWGGRGIIIAEEWLTFAGFYADMGDRPSDRHTLERKDNTLGYSKGNCYWATTAEQALNRRSNVHLTHDGITLTLKEWADRTGLHPVTISSRLRRGYSVAKALEGRLHAGAK